MSMSRSRPSAPSKLSPPLSAVVGRQTKSFSNRAWTLQTRNIISITPIFRSRPIVVPNDLLITQNIHCRTLHRYPPAQFPQLTTECQSLPTTSTIPCTSTSQPWSIIIPRHHASFAQSQLHCIADQIVLQIIPHSIIRITVSLSLRLSSWDPTLVSVSRQVRYLFLQGTCIQPYFSGFPHHIRFGRYCQWDQRQHLFVR